MQKFPTDFYVEKTLTFLFGDNKWAFTLPKRTLVRKPSQLPESVADFIDATFSHRYNLYDNTKSLESMQEIIRFQAKIFLNGRSRYKKTVAKAMKVRISSSFSQQFLINSQVFT